MVEKIVEMSDKVTGESYPVTETFAWTDKEVEQPKYKTNYQGHSDGIGEVNEGEYLVDDTGYCSLADILKRCLRQGINPVQMVEGETTADEVLAEGDPELYTGEAVTQQPAQPVDNSNSENVENVEAVSHDEIEKASE